MTLRVKGLPLTRTPAYVDENGFSVFHLSDKVDIVETLNAARTQVFPDVRIPAVDKVFDQIMAARAAVAAKGEEIARMETLELRRRRMAAGPLELSR